MYSLFNKYMFSIIQFKYVFAFDATNYLRVQYNNEVKQVAIKLFYVVNLLMQVLFYWTIKYYNI